MTPISFSKIETLEVHYKGMTYSITPKSIHMVEISDKHLLRFNLLDNKHVEAAEVTKIEVFNYDGTIKIHYRTKFGEGSRVYQNFHLVDHIYGKTKINLANKEFWEYLKDIRRIKCERQI